VSPREIYASRKRLIERELRRTVPRGSPRSLYPPIHYSLTAGGKRIRPVLVLLAAEAVGGNVNDALPASVAVELLHSFSLVHDDIMDNSNLRRGRPTVHTKWDPNVAILAGDALIGIAYRSLLKSPVERLPEIGRTFTEAVVEVCEGQAFDMEFERMDHVPIPRYVMMIAKKTGALITASSRLGALCGGGSPEEIASLTRFGEALGRAFQVQDDLLDITSSERELGKPVGADLIEGKKTFLLLTALRRAKGEDRTFLRTVVNRGGARRRDIPRVRRMYERLGVVREARRAVDDAIREARACLDGLRDSPAKGALFYLADMLGRRVS